MFHDGTGHNIPIFTTKLCWSMLFDSCVQALSPTTNVLWCNWASKRKNYHKPSSYPEIHYLGDTFRLCCSHYPTFLANSPVNQTFEDAAPLWEGYITMKFHILFTAYWPCKRTLSCPVGSTSGNWNLSSVSMGERCSYIMKLRLNVKFTLIWIFLKQTKWWFVAIIFSVIEIETD